MNYIIPKVFAHHEGAVNGGVGTTRAIKEVAEVANTSGGDYKLIIFIGGIVVVLAIATYFWKK